MNDRLSELEFERVILVDDIERINLQLSDPNRLDENNERITGRAYFEWRQKAMDAKRVKLSQLRVLNKEIETLKGDYHREQFTTINSKLDKIIEYMEEEVE